MILDPKIPRSVIASYIKDLKTQEHHKITREGVFKKAVGAVLQSEEPMKGLIMLAQVSEKLRGWYSRGWRPSPGGMSVACGSRRE